MTLADLAQLGRRSSDDVVAEIAPAWVIDLKAAVQSQLHGASDALELDDESLPNFAVLKIGAEETELLELPYRIHEPVSPHAAERHWADVGEKGDEPAALALAQLLRDR